MAKEWKEITDNLARFAMEQQVFFIASAPGDDDDVNLSPKGVATLKVLGPDSVTYADYTGSGNQTAKHLSAGGKATIMFVSFGEKPLILRFYCTGKVAPKGSSEFYDILRKHYPEDDPENFRQVFIFDVYRVQTSCGYGAPMMEYKGDRSEKKYFGELFGEAD